jgi:hypothetical protein
MRAGVAADEICWVPFSDRPRRDERLGASGEDLLVEALREAQSYRELAQAAMHALHELRGERDYLRDARERLLDEYRRLREQILRSEAA